MRNVICGLALGFLALGLLGCSTEPKTDDAKASLHDDTQATINQFGKVDVGFRDFLNSARVCVVFPTVGKGGMGVGGAYGHGEVYQNGRMIGYADLTQASIGLQAGGQSYSEVIVFENEDARISSRTTSLNLRPMRQRSANVRQPGRHGLRTASRFSCIQGAA
jgi:lipid-binding SYLF domain-containing protein